MGVAKGTDNFKAFRSSKQEAMVSLLRLELERASKRNMPYPDKTTLVSDMAHRTKIHRSTLVRNARYHILILEFLGRQAGASGFVIDADASPELLRAKLIDAQMRIGELQNELEKERSKSAPWPRNDLTGDSEAHMNFADTVWALRSVIDRVNCDGLLLEVDVEVCEIRDLAAPAGRQSVVEGGRLKPFIDALKRLREQEK